ncbi:hypothetical protein [Desulfolutivibrio sulfoxidireducens]|uniref:hypothetical protein n=1 Tax=Desulfolutivibrio sulfoxidireducens TaxID=2773299 RepID=UPI00159D93D4|nr:hypothetical protein [Desulfolutivibrio sulfoxidireducens]QLA17231.1 hypothetical protein GD605_14615 [Desulfolutivibrio sulfoxidireducens]
MRDILAAQKEMLAELREIRVLLAQKVDAPSGLSPEPPLPHEEPLPAEAEFTLEPEPSRLEPQPAPGPLTPRDLQDLGQSFTQARPAKSRTGLVDVSDLKGSLLDEIKGKNRAKSRAFDEFSKYRRDE